MKVTDLMIRDWVNYKSPSSGKLQPVKIKNIYGVEFNCEVEYWNIKSGYSISDTEPIKLTEDILVKNGFLKRSGKEYYLKDDIVIFVGSDSCEVCTLYGEYTAYSYVEEGYTTIATIHYVHQLQHLLRLCGIEKEIEL